MAATVVAGMAELIADTMGAIAEATTAAVGAGADLLPVQFLAGCSLRRTIMGTPITIRALATITGHRQEMRWRTACDGLDRMILGVEHI
jgi:hypothetical protein